MLGKFLNEFIQTENGKNSLIIITADHGNGKFLINFNQKERLKILSHYHIPLLMLYPNNQKKIAAQPPEASRRAKRLLRMSQNVPLQDALEMAASQQSMLQQLDDHREAIDALLEKRKPNYKNS